MHIIPPGYRRPRDPSKHSTPALAQFEQAGEAPSQRTLRRRHREQASGRRRAGGLVAGGMGGPAISRPRSLPLRIGEIFICIIEYKASACTPYGVSQRFGSWGTVKDRRRFTSECSCLGCIRDGSGAVRCFADSIHY